MNPEPPGAPRPSAHRLSDILAAEAQAFGGAEPAAPEAPPSAPQLTDVPRPRHRGYDEYAQQPQPSPPGYAQHDQYDQQEPPQRGYGQHEPPQHGYNQYERRHAPNARPQPYTPLPDPEAAQPHPSFEETESAPTRPSATQPTGDGGTGHAKAAKAAFWTGAWARRGMVFAILVVQSLLSLRNNNSAFVDEALYLYSGHLEIGQIMHGVPTGDNFWAFFSGAPVLYPVLGAMADGIGGLFAARLLSLAFMLGATCMLYLITRRMLGTRAAVCAAALFSCTEPVIFVGNLATYDAPALFLVSFAAWIVVRFARTTWPVYLLAILPSALAIATKYAALMFIPVVLVLAFLTAYPREGLRALIRPTALAAGIAAVLYGAVKVAGENALKGVEVTTTSRPQGRNTTSQVLDHAAQWGGALFVISLLGAIFLLALPRTHELKYVPASRLLRVCIVLLLCGTALMPALYQAHLHTTISLQKHVGFGLFFAAPLAGYGLARIAAKHVLRAAVGVAMLATTFILGMNQSLTLFHVWPDSAAMVQDIANNAKPNGRYLVGSDAVAIYALRTNPDCQKYQFTDTWSFSYRNSKKQLLHGTDAFTAAIQAGYFQVIVYTGAENPPAEKVIIADLKQATNYKLIDTIPQHTSSGFSRYYVWVRQPTVKH